MILDETKNVERALRRGRLWKSEGALNRTKIHLATLAGLSVSIFVALFLVCGVYRRNR